MYEKLKKEIKDILEIVKECPEKFQEKCFEVLLSSFLEREKETKVPEKVKEKKFEVPHITEKVKEEDIHMKVKALLKRFDLNTDLIGKLFLIEEGQIEPTYKLETTKMAESQVQISLLEALKEAIKTGNFEFKIEEIRALYKDRKCYDKANFLAIFKKNKGLFKNETFVKEEPVELSDEGLKELAATITKLTGGEKE